MAGIVESGSEECNGKRSVSTAKYENAGVRACVCVGGGRIKSTCYIHTHMPPPSDTLSPPPTHTHAPCWCAPKLLHVALRNHPLTHATSSLFGDNRLTHLLRVDVGAASD